MLHLYGLPMYRDKLHIAIPNKQKEGLIIKHKRKAGTICYKSEHSSKSRSIS